MADKFGYVRSLGATMLCLIDSMDCRKKRNPKFMDMKISYTISEIRRFIIMGLIEFIGELIRPGKIGTVDITKREKEKRIGMLIVKTILSIAIVTVLYYLIFAISFNIKELIVFIAVMVVYSVAGYFILPKPDYSNVGWLGGVFNNPFRISDNVNRMLFFIMVILMPGRLISTTVLSWIELLKKEDVLKSS